MTGPQAASSKPRLARKGLAVPAGPAGQAGLVDSGAEMDREASTETSAPITNPEAVPAASLLPVDFPGARGPSFDPARLPRAEPQVTFGPSAEPLDAPPVPSATPAKAETPRVDPSWRIGHDPKPARPGRRRARPALAAALAVVAVLGVGWHAHRAGWLDFEAPTAERVEAPNETAAQDAPGLSPSAVPARSPADQDADPGPAPEAAPPSIDVVRVEPDGAAVITGRAAPGAELIVLDNGAPIGTATADAFGEWVFIPDAPLPAGAHEFGLVVKRVQGGATLPAAGAAGEAREQDPAGGAPGRGPDARAIGSEREPSAQALDRINKVEQIYAVDGIADGDANQPRSALVPARKPAAAGAAARENGGVRPGASSANFPGTDFPGTDFPGADFVVQLASVKTRAGAAREWRALRRRFPKLLGGMRLSLDEAKLAGGVSVVRLRTGAFADARAAAALCQRLAAKRQDCLVVRAAAGG